MSTAKSVTKTGLSTFVRENSELNLTQAKALSDRLLRDYDIVLKPPATGEITVAAGQTWRDTITHRTVLVTHVEVGPQFIRDDPVVAWGPQRVHWRDDTDFGTAEISTWRQRMALQDEDTHAPNERTPA